MSSSREPPSPPKRVPLLEQDRLLQRRRLRVAIQTEIRTGLIEAVGGHVALIFQRVLWRVGVLVVAARAVGVAAQSGAAGGVVAVLALVVVRRGGDREGGLGVGHVFAETVAAGVTGHAPGGLVVDV